jgi:predicted phosphate transport protein (TIGR00153 family)
MNPLGKLFGRSPFAALQRHMEKAHECASETIPFMDAVLENDWGAALAIQKRIQQLEEQADAIKREIRANLPGGLLIPVKRSDVLELLRMQDKIPNRARDIAGLMIGRRMVIPPGMANRMREFVASAVDTSAQALGAIEELDELLEAGFAGREANLIHEMVSRLDELETRADELEVQIRDDLFALESELPAVNVMFLYKVIDWIGELADLAQRVGSRLELMMAG